MDKFIKYPLPLDKKQVEESTLYKSGIKQLVEILEKEFPVDKLEREANLLKIREDQIVRLKYLIRYNFDTSKVKDILNYKDIESVNSLFYRGAGLLSILYNHISLTPVVEEKEIISRYSFIDYDIIRNELGILVVSKINKENWSSDRKDEYMEEKMTKYFCYQIVNQGELEETYNLLHESYPLRQEMIDMYNISKEMEVER